MTNDRKTISGTYTHKKTGTAYEYDATYWEHEGKLHCHARVRFADGPGKGAFRGEPTPWLPIPLGGFRSNEDAVRDMVGDAIEIRFGVAREEGES